MPICNPHEKKMLIKLIFQTPIIGQVEKENGDICVSPLFLLFYSNFLGSNQVNELFLVMSLFEKQQHAVGYWGPATSSVDW